MCFWASAAVACSSDADLALPVKKEWLALGASATASSCNWLRPRSRMPRCAMASVMLWPLWCNG